MDLFVVDYCVYAMYCFVCEIAMVEQYFGIFRVA